MFIEIPFSNPYFVIPLDNGKIPLAMIQTMKKLKSGYINGTRVMLGQLSDFLNTSAITDLSFLGSQEDGYPERLNQGEVSQGRVLLYRNSDSSLPIYSCPSLLGRALVAVV